MTRRKPAASLDLLTPEPQDAMRPLAERMRPRVIDEMVGQPRLLAPASAQNLADYLRVIPLKQTQSAAQNFRLGALGVDFH